MNFPFEQVWPTWKKPLNYQEDKDRKRWQLRKISQGSLYISGQKRQNEAFLNDFALCGECVREFIGTVATDKEETLDV